MCCPLFTPSCSLPLSLPRQCHFLSPFFTSSSLLLALHSRSHLSPSCSAKLTVAACSFTSSSTSVLALPSFLTCLVLPPHVWLRRSGRCFFFILPFYSDCIYPPTPNLCSHFAPTPHSNRVRSLTPRPLLSPLCERHHLLFMLSFILPSALNLLYLCSVSVSPLCLPLCFACVARPL